MIDKLSKNQLSGLERFKKSHRSQVARRERIATSRKHEYSPIYLMPRSKSFNVISSHLVPLIALILLSLFVSASRQQSSISLATAQWFVNNSNGSITLPAEVPGGIYSDLKRNNVLKQDILYGKNDVAFRWVGQENWTYTTAFTIDQQMATSQSVKLVLHGVDTVAQVILNGELIGSTDNMFIRYKFDIKPHLRLAGLKNILSIKFESPIKYAAKRSHQSIRQNRGKIIPPYCPSPAQRGECHVNFIRKMQASFSWDWGPAFPSVGIYKDISIEFGSLGIIRDILVETRRLESLVHVPRQPAPPPPQIIISSNIRQQLQAPLLNKSMPYLRAPPYYIAMNDENRHLFIEQTLPKIDLTEGFVGGQSQLMDENWLLKITLVAEMVQPSFGYNLRVEFNLNGVLHYESEHINVVANSDGFIRLGFNLRIDTSRMRIKPWWPNNAGGQTMYRLTARMMPLPSPISSLPDHIRIQTNSSNRGAARSSRSSDLDPLLQSRAKPQNLLQQTMSASQFPPMAYLATPPEVDSFQIQQVSEKQISFGFRTVELIQEPVVRGTVEEGLTFNFRVNGIDLFAMGSNWIPASILPENSNDLEHIRYLLQSAKDANMNMLRVWGGGLYESDEFYELADELGIMIWHDFMFACALYPVDDDFIGSVRLEIEQQVQRLQHHPSIVLWAGNNENEMAIAGPWWPEVMIWNKKLRENYAKLYTETIRPIVQILDPTRPYIESSPTNGLMSQSQPYTISRVPNDNKFGDVHHYDYLSDSFEWSNYPSTRFASEYGFQSYPSFNALASISTPSDWKYPLTPNILHRQHRLTGETEMKLQIKSHFNEIKQGGVEKFKTFIYLSQLTQAIAIKTETEFYRRNRFIDPETKLGKTMGALYWQLNDVWQGPTWSSIEFGGKWKMLHYFARRFFFPIQVIPYLVQPPAQTTTVGNSIQQVISSSTSSMLAGLSGRVQSFIGPAGGSGGQLLFNESQSLQYANPFQQQQQPSGPLFFVDLVRDDMLHPLDSFNVTIRFFRYTSFTPVWQDTVYVRYARPQNVTRIYEQDLGRIIRSPGVISISSGVFQVVIEQQPRLGLSQIENYLMPVAPNRITAMRVPRISVELIQGPFELLDMKPGGSDQRSRAAAGSGGAATAQWACAYRLTLVSDSIAMFVWLDLNLVNSGAQISGGGSNDELPVGQQQSAGGAQQLQTDQAVADQVSSSVQLNALPPSSDQFNLPPEHIRVYLNRDKQAAAAAEPLQLAASERLPMTTLEKGERPTDLSSSAEADDSAHVAQRKARELRSTSRGQILTAEGAAATVEDDRDLPEGVIAATIAAASGATPKNRRQAMLNKHSKVKTAATAEQRFKPVDGAGSGSSSQIMRFQFSDNAFNMLEPSKVIDLYLSRCLSKPQVEVGLEIQSLADSL